MRVIFFGAGGPFAAIALEEISRVATIAAVVVPSLKGRGVRRLVRYVSQIPAGRRLKRPDAPLIRYQSSRELVERLAALNADLICVASFPDLIPTDIRATARLGAINLHSSLLPRHRGPDPIFWTYFQDERETGVTVHWMDDGIDTGDIILQTKVPLPRGTSGIDLYMQLAHAGSRLMADAVQAIGSGTATATPQRAADAIAEPSPGKQTWSIDYEKWTAERLQHFIRGVEHRSGFTLRDRNGVAHFIGRLARWGPEAHSEIPGSILPRAHGTLAIYCMDGVVEVRRPPLTSRARAWLRNLKATRRRGQS